MRKYLYKNAVFANFDRFRDGRLYYRLITDMGDYEFSMSASDDDMKGADFSREMEAKHLWRWIEKSMNSNDFVKLF